MLSRLGPTCPPAPATAWHFRHCVSLRRKTASPRAGSPSRATSASERGSLLGVVSGFGAASSSPALRQRLDQAAARRGPSRALARRASLATSAGSVLPASAAARAAGPPLQPGERARRRSSASAGSSSLGEPGRRPLGRDLSGRSPPARAIARACARARRVVGREPLDRRAAVGPPSSARPSIGRLADAVRRRPIARRDRFESRPQRLDLPDARPPARRRRGGRRPGRRARRPSRARSPSGRTFRCSAAFTRPSSKAARAARRERSARRGPGRRSPPGRRAGRASRSSVRRAPPPGRRDRARRGAPSSSGLTTAGEPTAWSAKTRCRGVAAEVELARRDRREPVGLQVAGGQPEGVVEEPVDRPVERPQRQLGRARLGDRAPGPGRPRAGRADGRRPTRGASSAERVGEPVVPVRSDPRRPPPGRAGRPIASSCAEQVGLDDVERLIGPERLRAAGARPRGRSGRAP